MKVCVSVSGRFHAFYLAQQFLKCGFLGQLITSYPKTEVMKYGIPKNYVTTILSNEILSRVWESLPRNIKKSWAPQPLLHERFDRLAAGRIKAGSNLFIGWSSFSLRSLRKAKELGMITILERGSSHIAFQRDMLQEEYSLHGIKTNPVHPRIVEKELKEYAEADYITVPSSFAKNTFIKQGVESNKIISVTLGYNTQEFRPYKKEDGIFRIIHCGGLTLQKGVHYLLKSFYELNLPNSELWLIGHPTDEIEPFLKKYYLSNIHLKGVFPQSKLCEQYAQGSVLCLASIEDGFGMVILQAMACGLPVIATKNTGAPDVIRDGLDGFIIPIRNVEALKEKIRFMYENQEKCKEMGRLARGRVSSDFTWDAYGDRIILEYGKIQVHSG